MFPLRLANVSGEGISAHIGVILFVLQADNFSITHRHHLYKAVDVPGFITMSQLVRHRYLPGVYCAIKEQL